MENNDNELRKYKKVIDRLFLITSYLAIGFMVSVFTWIWGFPNGFKLTLSFFIATIFMAIWASLTKSVTYDKFNGGMTKTAFQKKLDELNKNY